MMILPAAEESERNTSPFGAKAIHRGLVKPPSAKVAISNPVGKFNLAPSGRAITRGGLVASSVAFGCGRSVGLISKWRRSGLVGGVVVVSEGWAQALET